MTNETMDTDRNVKTTDEMDHSYLGEKSAISWHDWVPIL